MVTGGTKVFGCAANFLRGRKCVFCGSFQVNRTRRGYVKCHRCKAQTSIKRRREISILQEFYQQVPAYRLASDLGVNAKVVSWVYQWLRTLIFHTAELGSVGIRSHHLALCQHMALHGAFEFRPAERRA